jgi:hypothetical protein
MQTNNRNPRYHNFSLNSPTFLLGIILNAEFKSGRVQLDELENDLAYGGLIINVRRSL